jgi:sarcosine oxidase subunit gamma
MSRIDIADARRSPLTHVAMPGGLRELPFLAQIAVQLDSTDERAVAAVSAAIGVDLPLEPNTVSSGADIAVLWMGPSEWLVVGPAGREVELESALTNALAGTGSSVVDVSANRTTLELSGPEAREILESGCSIDLDPRSFSSGQCAQTLVARAHVLLWRPASHPETVYRLLVRPSFAAYLAAWLIDAGSQLHGRI